MKKLLILFLLTTSVASAQFEGHVKGGLAMSVPVVSGSFPEKENLVSFYIGGDFDAPLNDKFTVSTGTVFSITGVENTPMIKKITFHNIQLPLSLKYYPAANFFIKPGIYATYIIDADMEGYAEDDAINDHIAVKKFDFGLLIGAGYTFNKITVEASYNFGFSNIVSLNGPSFPEETGIEDPVYKNRFFLFGIAYRLR